MLTYTISAIQWTFGMTVRQAEWYYKEHKDDRTLLKTIVQGYRDHCKKSFNED